jgi:sporulation protein YlmC with PRC-barrel domain
MGYNREMVKLITDIIDAQVLLFQEKAHVGPVRDVIIAPVDGSFLGVMIFDPIDRMTKVVPASEIKGSGKDFLLIKDYSSLTEPDDVVRIKAALEINPKIIGARVETKSGQYIGKVNNATINFKLMCLERLYVSPASLLEFLAKDLIISAKNIVEIQKDKIIVSDTYATVKEKSIVTTPALAIE